MAQFATGTFVDSDAMYQQIRTMMLANGWTLIDTISDVVNNRDQVFQGGYLDSVANNRIYMRMRWVPSYFSLLPCSAYDSGTNQAQHAAGSTSQCSCNWTNYHYYIRVNDWAVAYTFVNGGTWYKGYGGFVRRGLAPGKAGLTRTTAAYSAGATTVNVASDMTGKLQVNQKVWVYNHNNNSASANWGSHEMATIQSITAGTITFAAPLSNGYDANAVIGWMAFPACSLDGDQYSSDTVSYTYPYCCYYPDCVHFGTTSQQGYTYHGIFGNEGYGDPDDVTQEFLGGVWTLHCTSSGRVGTYGYFYHYECCAGGGQIRGDLMDDGANQYYVVMGGYSSANLIIGPV